MSRFQPIGSRERERLSYVSTGVNPTLGTAAQNAYGRMALTQHMEEAFGKDFRFSPLDLPVPQANFGPARSIGSFLSGRQTNARNRLGMEAVENLQAADRGSASGLAEGMSLLEMNGGADSGSRAFLASQAARTGNEARARARRDNRLAQFQLGESQDAAAVSAFSADEQNRLLLQRLRNQFAMDRYGIQMKGLAGEQMARAIEES